MKRRFNYTNRKNITANNVIITINRDQNNKPYFDFVTDFEDINLPDNTKIYLEAYHKSGFMRFDLGTLNNIQKPNNTYLTDFGYIKNIKFRVKAIDTSSEKGKILAMAKNISQEGDDENGQENLKSILNKSDNNIGNKPWRLEFDDDTPCLVFNTQIKEIENLSMTNNMFFFLIYPEVIKEILNQMIFIDKIEDINNPYPDWHEQWLTYIEEKITDLPDSLDINDVEEEEINDWIARVVNEFCNLHVDRWNKLLEEL